MVVGAEVLVEPQPFVRQRYTPAWWLFCEAVYEQLPAEDRERVGR